MAYLDRKPGNARVVAVTAVALLHGAAFYALMTGLAVTYIKEIMPVLIARNIPVDRPAPAPPAPRVDDKQVIDRVSITAPTPRLPLDVTGPAIGTGSVAPQGEPRIIGEVSFLPLPTPSPVPAFTPAAARPRGNMGLWATTSDYPARDLREGNQGVTRFTLAIDGQGRVQGCTITGSSGFPGLDQATCHNVSRRARFEPATDTAGQRVPGTFSSSIRWVIPED